MKIPIRVTLDKDGTEEKFDLTADDRDVRAFESEFDENWLTSALSYSQLGKLAWLAARRQGKFTGDWKAFDKVAAEVSNVPDEEDEKEAGEVEPSGPTKRGRGAGS